MSATFLPPIFVPLIGVILPFIFIISFFKFLEKENVS